MKKKLFRYDWFVDKPKTKELPFMPTLSHLPGALQNILLQAARQAGLESRFLLRRSKLSPEVFVQTLVFGWLANPAASLQQLAQTAALLGTNLSAQALDQRFNSKSAHGLKLVLEAALQQVFAADPVTVPLLERFTSVQLIDTSVIVLPDELLEVWAGCGGSAGKTSALKVEIGLDLLTGRLQGPPLHSGRTHDPQGVLHGAASQAGCLRLADLAYFDLQRLRQLNEQGSYWITRVKSTTKIADEAGNQGTILEFLNAQHSDQIDARIKLGQGEQLACRIVAVKVSQQVADERRRRLKDKARRNGQPLKQAALELAGWSVYVTNVEQEEVSPQRGVCLSAGALADRVDLQAVEEPGEGRAVAQQEGMADLVRSLCQAAGDADPALAGDPGRLEE